MAAIEVCFKKLTGSAGDYSEQQLVDCGYKQNGANGNIHLTSPVSFNG